MARYGMVIDLKRCIGCYGCLVACKAENFTPPGVFWARVLRREEGRFPLGRKISLPLLCMHCGDPACVRVCPTGASTQRDDGIVIIDSNKCFGCRYCMMACPYGSRFFYSEERQYFPKELTPYEKLGREKHPVGVVEKCDFCVSRIEKGLEPACVANCMSKARYFGDLDDPESEVSRLIRQRQGFQLRPEAGTDPSVFYLSP